MLSDLSLIQSASGMARHAAERHRVIAENMANADTPGYRARDVEDFATAVKDAFTPRATRPGHMGDAGSNPSVRIVEAQMPAAPNGNSVVLEDQMFRAAETQGQHRLAMTVYSKTVDLLRLGLGRMR